MRLNALDGLRGIAALAVVGYHLLLASPSIADGNGYPIPGTPRWWIEFSPLKIFTAGPEAVLVFFVLSGLVLVLPVVRRPGFDWLGYFPRRALRLGLPVVASIVFAAALILVHPQTVGPQVSSWVGSSSVPNLSLGLFVQSLDVLAAYNLLNNPLWTLRWELIFSLALPIYVYIAVRASRHWVLCAVATFLLVVLGAYTGSSYLQVLPLFFAGAVIAVHLDAVRAWAQSRQATVLHQLAWGALLLGGLMLLISPRLLAGVIGGQPELTSLTSGLTMVGAVVVVLGSFLWRPAAAALTIAPSHWLGRVSFSLYLVHVPILIAVANVIGPGGAQWVAIIAITLPLSLVVAELFYRFVEMPAHRLSKRVGANASALFAAKTPAPPTEQSPAQS